MEKKGEKIWQRIQLRMLSLEDWNICSAMPNVTAYAMIKMFNIFRY